MPPQPQSSRNDATKTCPIVGAHGAGDKAASTAAAAVAAHNQGTVATPQTPNDNVHNHDLYSSNNNSSNNNNNKHALHRGTGAHRLLAPRSSSSSTSSALLLQRLSRPRIADRPDAVRHGLAPAPARAAKRTPVRRVLADPSTSTSQYSSAPAVLATMDSDSDENPNADLTLEDTVLEISDSDHARTVETGRDRDKKMSSLYSSIQARLQEATFLFADGNLSVALTFALILVDATFFLAFLVYMLLGNVPAMFQTLYNIVDMLTGVMYFCEVNSRLFSYGFWYYCHSLLRVLDYIVSVSNAVVVLASVTYARRTKWLLIIRYVRLLRALTVTTMTRERFLRAQTRKELQDLAELLDRERSDQGRLVKWRIDPDAIALGESAGKGMFGAVFLGLFRGTLVAVKQLYQSNDAAQQYATIEDEAVTLVNLRHPNVVLFMGFVHEPDKLWIVTEYCSRGSIRDLLDKPEFHLTQSRILKLALGAARGLAYLHGQDPPVLHLDLKTSNILISSGWDTKLADFGLSRNIDNIQNNTFAGTIQYSAPEILESNLFGTAADVYSFGICLWEMAARETPFKDNSPMDVLWGVVKQNRRPSLDGIATPSEDKGSDPCVVTTSSNLAHVDSFSETLSPSSFDPASTLSTVALETDLATFIQGRQVQRRSEPPFASTLVDADALKPAWKSAMDLGACSPVGSARAKLPRGIKIPNSPAAENGSSKEFQGEMNEPVVSVGQLVSPETMDWERNAFRRPPLSPRISIGKYPVCALVESNDKSPPVSSVVVRGELGSKALITSVQPIAPEGQSDWSSLLSAKIQQYDDRPLVAKRAPIATAGAIPAIGTSRMMETFRLKKRSSEPGCTGSDHGDSERDCAPDDNGVYKTATSATTFQQRLESLSALAGRRSKVPMMRDMDFSIMNSEEREAAAAVLSRRAVSPSRSSHVPLSEDCGSVHMSKEYIELITNCWAQSPGDRPSADEVVWRLVGLIDEHIRRGADKQLPGSQFRQ